MCQIDGKSTETMQCTGKDICCKMQKEGIRAAIDALRKNVDGVSSNSCYYIIGAIEDLLEGYYCLPRTCLIKRIQRVRKTIDCRTELCKSEKVKVNMLCAELEAFISSC